MLLKQQKPSGMLASGSWGGLKGSGAVPMVSATPRLFLSSPLLRWAPAWSAPSPPRCKAFSSLSLWLGFQLLSKRHLLHEHPASVSEASLQKRHCCLFRLPARPNERQSLAETRTKGFLGQVAFLLKGALLAEEGAPLHVPLLQRTLD